MGADVLVEWMYMIETEAWDKKEYPLHSNFPLNVNIMPKLVVTYTERTLSFDKFFSHISCEMWEIMDHFVCTGQRASVTVQ